MQAVDRACAARVAAAISASTSSSASSPCSARIRLGQLGSASTRRMMASIIATASRGIGAGRRFGRQHQRVGALVDAAGDVGGLGAGRGGGADHRFQHLGGDDHRRAAAPGGADDALLHHRHLLRRQLDAEVAAGHHDAVADVEDRLQVVDRGRLLDLGQDRRAALDDAPQLRHVAGVLHERQRQPVDADPQRDTRRRPGPSRSAPAPGSSRRARRGPCGRRAPRRPRPRPRRSSDVSALAPAAAPCRRRAAAACPARSTRNTSGWGSATRRRSPGSGSRSRRSIWPGAMSMRPSLKTPSRNFGPCRSASTASGRPIAASALRTACSACERGPGGSRG